MKKRVILLGVLFVFIIFLSLYFDNSIIQIISSIRNSFLNELFLKIAFISSAVILFVFLAGLFLWRKNKRRWLFPLLFAMGSSVGISFLLKIVVQRLRPYQIGIVSALPELEKASHLVWNFSFPSFHAMLAFSTVPFLSKEFPVFKYTWIIFAGLIAFSRIYLGLHFLSDVLVGGLIGYLIGTLILKYEKENKFFEKIIKKLKRN